MKKFIISSHHFINACGGLKVLHKLCHVLNERGYDAYLAPWDGIDSYFPLYEKYDKCKVVTQDLLDNINDHIVIYPEILHGNKLNAKNVVRWLLAFPQFGAETTWGQSDLWFWYSPYYTTNEVNKHSENVLRIVEQHRDIFYDKKLPREGSCYTIRKADRYIDDSYIIHPSDSTNISYDDAGDLERLADLFNSKEIFYCYDNHTFLSIQSVMCNTDCVVIPKRVPPVKTRDEFFNQNDLNKYLAFGMDDLDRARNVRNELFDHLDLIENTTMQQIDDFVQKCYDYFK